MVRIIIISLVTIGFTLAQNKMKAPEKKQQNHNMEKYGTGDNQFLNFYQNRLSPVKGGNTCPMHPSCSQYAKITFEYFPFYLAYPKSMARILSCGHQLYLFKIVKHRDGFRWYDPVIINNSENEDH